MQVSATEEASCSRKVREGMIEVMKETSKSIIAIETRIGIRGARTAAAMRQKVKAAGNTLTTRAEKAKEERRTSITSEETIGTAAATATISTEITTTAGIEIEDRKREDPDLGIEDQDLVMEESDDVCTSNLVWPIFSMYEDELI